MHTLVQMLQTRNMPHFRPTQGCTILSSQQLQHALQHMHKEET